MPIQLERFGPRNQPIAKLLLLCDADSLKEVFIQQSLDRVPQRGLARVSSRLHTNLRKPA